MHIRKKIVLFLAFYAIIGIISVMFWNEIDAFDILTLNYITSFQTTFLNEIFTSVTFGGSILFWMLVVALFWTAKQRKLSICLFVGLVIEELLSGIMKYSIQRPRPPNPVLEQFTPAFPSGHTARSVIGAILIKNYRFVFVPLSVLVMFSRLYLGVHYPSDIFFGVMNGIFVALLIQMIPEKKIENYLTIFRRKLNIL